VKIQSRGIETTPAGFSTFNNDHDEELTFAQTIVQFFLTPLRRELDRPWFQTVVRYGKFGGEETFIDPDSNKEVTLLSAPLHPTVTDQFYIFLNDAVIGIPGIFTAFYDHDHGCVSVFIRPR
jgi:hypothetical protein